MPLDAQFLRVVRQHFDPLLASSGTELVGPLLYWLARMTRPRTIVEYGSGYSTLFILNALSDTVIEIEAEEKSLRSKTHHTRILDRWPIKNEADILRVTTPDVRRGQDTSDGEITPESLLNDDWFGSGGVACGVDPTFYLKPYTPRLFSFERLSSDHEYVRRMDYAVEAIGCKSLFTHVCGAGIRKDALPSTALPIDLAWNDDDKYVEFFAEFWESLNPSGGIMIFHNTTGWPENYEAIKAIVQQRETHRDLECLLLEEPHKLNQNGCAILRRTTEYRPRFPLLQPARILRALGQLMSDK